MSLKISTILTCHNRKEKTLNCLKSLFVAAHAYETKEETIELNVYLTDDDCTDGTADAINEEFPNKSIHILRGNGNLFWAGGMRLAWKEALEHETPDYYLLLNDDTTLLDNAFKELLENNCNGIVSGITCSNNREKTTYGGNIWTNKFLAKSKRLDPIGLPQECDITNANILLIAKNVVDRIGIFSESYTHGCADYDYSILAKQKGFPIFVTSHYCGLCDNDHTDFKTQEKEVMQMTLSERKQHFNHPLHSTKDYLTFIRRNAPLRYPFVWIGRFCNVYLPHLYYKLNHIRL